MDRQTQAVASIIYQANGNQIRSRASEHADLAQESHLVIEQM
jgi:hypothetical protein